MMIRKLRAGRVLDALPFTPPASYDVLAVVPIGRRALCLFEHRASRRPSHRALVAISAQRRRPRSHWAAWWLEQCPPLVLDWRTEPYGHRVLHVGKSRPETAALRRASRLGGGPVFNARHERLPAGEWRYAVHLGADLFECYFGDAGSLHVWLDGDRAFLLGDSA
jgi:hypothetical protein